MISKIKIIFSLLIIISFASCNSREKEEKQADLRLDNIRELITANKLNEAKSKIDSIHALYPRLVDKRKLAVALQDTIILRESYRTLNYTAKILPDLTEAYKILLKNFILQKNEKYEKIGKYVYKSQVGEQNTGRNYLKFEVDENGDTYLTSMYSGTKLNQYTIQISAVGMTVTTDTTAKNSGVLHAFNDGERYYEQLTFKNEADGGIAEFIHKNKNLTLKVNLIGTKNSNYVLQQADKEAISQTFKFAQARKLLHKTENDLRIAQQRIGKINLLYKE